MSNPERIYEFGEKLNSESEWTFLFETEPKIYTNKQKGNKEVRLRKAFFLCECGGVEESFITDVKTGKSKRCKSSKHKYGKTRQKWGWVVDHPLYNTYKGMISRCYYKGSSGYSNYGARGIVVCDRWLGEKGFVNFLEDMGERPDSYTLDRVDTNGNYSPENCQWADGSNQGFNKRLLRSNTSGAVGVSYDKSNDKWKAYIKKARQTKELGRFSTFEEAVEARREAELEYYGYNNNYWLEEEEDK